MKEFHLVSCAKNNCIIYKHNKIKTQLSTNEFYRFYDKKLNFANYIYLFIYKILILIDII